LGKLDSLGTTVAFTLGPGGVRGEDLSANHMIQLLEEGLDDDGNKICNTTNIHNRPPVRLQVLNHSDNPSWAVPFHHLANMINMPKRACFDRKTEPFESLNVVATYQASY